MTRHGRAMLRPKAETEGRTAAFTARGTVSLARVGDSRPKPHLTRPFRSGPSWRTSGAVSLDRSRLAVTRRARPSITKGRNRPQSDRKGAS